VVFLHAEFDGPFLYCDDVKRHKYVGDVKKMPSQQVKETGLNMISRNDTTPGS
jgi:hypothetical protein